MASHNEGDDDTAAMPPLCGEEEFADEVRELVESSAPRVFALVQEQGERFDAWVTAWGLEFEDGCVQIVRAGNGLGGTFPSVERAVRRYSRRKKIRLVWISTTATRPTEDQPV